MNGREIVLYWFGRKGFKILGGSEGGMGVFGIDMGRDGIDYFRKFVYYVIWLWLGVWKIIGFFFDWFGLLDYVGIF